MNHTGVFATEEELKEAQKLVDRASNTPIISCGMGRPGMSSVAWDACRKRIYQMALAHELPEIPGYYGIDAKGEFLQA